MGSPEKKCKELAVEVGELMLETETADKPDL